MTSTLLVFDKLAYIDRLKGSGIEELQARAHAEALDVALRDTVATKADVEALGRDMRATGAKLDAKIDAVEQKLDTKIDAVAQRLDAKIDAVDVKLTGLLANLEVRLRANIETSAAGVKVDILRWLLVTQAGLAGFIFAVLKFLH